MHCDQRWMPSQIPGWCASTWTTSAPDANGGKSEQKGREEAENVCRVTIFLQDLHLFIFTGVQPQFHDWAQLRLQPYIYIYYICIMIWLSLCDDPIVYRSPLEHHIYVCFDLLDKYFYYMNGRWRVLYALKVSLVTYTHFLIRSEW